MSRNVFVGGELPPPSRGLFRNKRHKSHSALNFGVPRDASPPLNALNGGGGGAVSRHPGGGRNGVDFFRARQHSNCGGAPPSPGGGGGALSAAMGGGLPRLGQALKSLRNGFISSKIKSAFVDADDVVYYANRDSASSSSSNGAYANGASPDAAMCRAGGGALVKRAVTGSAKSLALGAPNGPAERSSASSANGSGGGRHRRGESGGGATEYFDASRQSLFSPTPSMASRESGGAAPQRHAPGAALRAADSDDDFSEYYDNHRARPAKRESVDPSYLYGDDDAKTSASSMSPPPPPKGYMAPVAPRQKLRAPGAIYQRNRTLAEIRQLYKSTPNFSVFGDENENDEMIENELEASDADDADDGDETENENDSLDRDYDIVEDVLGARKNRNNLDAFRHSRFGSHDDGCDGGGSHHQLLPMAQKLQQQPQPNSGILRRRSSIAAVGGGAAWARDGCALKPPPPAPPFPTIYGELVESERNAKNICHKFPPPSYASDEKSHAARVHYEEESGGAPAKFSKNVHPTADGGAQFAPRGASNGKNLGDHAAAANADELTRYAAATQRQPPPKDADSGALCPNLNLSSRQNLNACHHAHDCSPATATHSTSTVSSTSSSLGKTSNSSLATSSRGSSRPRTTTAPPESPTPLLATESSRRARDTQLRSRTSEDHRGRAAPKEDDEEHGGRDASPTDSGYRSRRQTPRLVRPDANAKRIGVAPSFADLLTNYSDKFVDEIVATKSAQNVQEFAELIFNLLALSLSENISSSNVVGANSTSFKPSEMATKCAQLIARQFRRQIAANSSANNANCRPQVIGGDGSGHARHSTTSSVIDPRFVDNPELSDIRFRFEVATPKNDLNPTPGEATITTPNAADASDTVIVYAHRIVLANASDAFRCLLKTAPAPASATAAAGGGGNADALPIHDISHVNFKMMLEYLYGNAPLCLGHFRQLDTVARQFEFMANARDYGLGDLSAECAREICAKICATNCLQIFESVRAALATAIAAADTAAANELAVADDDATVSAAGAGETQQHLRALQKECELFILQNLPICIESEEFARQLRRAPPATIGEGATIAADNLDETLKMALIRQFASTF